MFGLLTGRIWLILALVAALGAASGLIWLNGRASGRAAVEAQYAKKLADLNERLFRVSEDASKAAAELDAARAARKVVERELEEAARNAPNANTVCLPADSVSRLRARYGDSD